VFDGKLILQEMKLETRHSFLDYITTGLEISLIVAIDFTRSNKDVNKKESMHHYDVSTANEYVLAIRAVGEILQHYDSDDRYPVYGFGCKIPPTHTFTSHCFALTGNFLDPEVDGVNGIVDIYREVLQKDIVKLHGPTYFAEVVELAKNFAAPFSNPTPDADQKYYILLIITDGVINDIEETIHQIVEASRTPLSIIIVGVGDNDFTEMERLDADDEPLISKFSGEKMCSLV
jgi:vacuolar-type H+-ATPase subunit F/Vma7